ncbi:uncharacterized protein LOC114182096 [Vigna unguiculata]|uniref:Uncharacterized protein n=1 Tax=Vigna unguiculata TaxID=3917 RepID=A0A4D6M0U1_VIGUN|nr:uncharacterized protein LOC114182096 [Vigna unguiculata]QCD94772.1 hypothetical protein DEO72_LG5g2859 [Vigna unguiculata]
MVVSLGPGKFYGTSLPRPRIYTDVKFNDHRVDPPIPVTDPLMSWAEEAHWSMGGLSFKRLRLQGKIEGNVQRLRSQREKAQSLSPTPAHSVPAPSERSSSPTPPPAPVVTKRRRYMDLIVDEEEDEEEEEPEVVEPPRTRVRKSRLVKKLGDDFDRVAEENDEPETMPLKTLTRARKLVKIAEKKTVVETAQKSKSNGKKSSTSEAEKSPRVRTSPRLAKRLSY